MTRTWMPTIDPSVIDRTTFDVMTSSCADTSDIGSEGVRETIMSHLSPSEKAIFVTVLIERRTPAMMARAFTHMSGHNVRRSQVSSRVWQVRRIVLAYLILYTLVPRSDVIRYTTARLRRAMPRIGARGSIASGLISRLPVAEISRSTGISPGAVSRARDLLSCRDERSVTQVAVSRFLRSTARDLRSRRRSWLTYNTEL